ncbi:MAG TPA: Hsp20/alpha crystallin family protein [Verrucomicrobiae bacterium]|nr:Hsp20/alpha crystallin family protein [Verrucomicrobiae bacterium]
MNLLIPENPFKATPRDSTSMVQVSGNDSSGGNGEDQADHRWLPATDILEDETEYLLRADLPGVRKDDLRVVRTGKTLTISGRRDLKNQPGQKAHRLERPRGNFLRRFPFPADASRNSVKARFADGVLEINLRKALPGGAETEPPRWQEVNIR